MCSVRLNRDPSSSSSPFDVEDLTLSSGNVSKAAALQRRVSVYSQGTPDTPTFQDSAFFVRIHACLMRSCEDDDDDVTAARYPEAPSLASWLHAASSPLH